MDDESKRAHAKTVWQAEQKAKAEQALRNIQNGRPLASDHNTLQNFIKNARL